MTKIIWFTGLSGSGKSTITEILIEKFKKLGKSFVIFDGDDVRARLHNHLGFTPEDIKENNKLIVELCRGEVGKIDFIVVPVISPFRESRDLARGIFGRDFIEVFLDCSYDECKKRDVKGLYVKAERGEVENFIGLHVPYEKPINPELVLDVVNCSPSKSAEKLLGFVFGSGASKLIDLQMHTTYSDGEFSPRKVIDLAVGRGMKTIAITDHDTLGGISEAAAYCNDKDIEFVPGIELSCKEGFYQKTIDILGLFIDPDNRALNEFVKRDRKRREIEKREIVLKLNKLGYEISFEEVVKKAGESMGRPTIARMLLEKYPDKFDSVNDVFSKLIGDGGPGYVHRDKSSMKEAIDVIRGAGGISVLAHPGRYIGEIEEIVDKFVLSGGKAIEADYPYGRILKIDKGQSDRINNEIRMVADEKGLLISGGSDYHGPDRGSDIGDGGVSEGDFEILKKFSEKLLEEYKSLKDRTL